MFDPYVSEVLRFHEAHLIKLFVIHSFPDFYAIQAV